jgi:hypothetical protein
MVMKPTGQSGGGMKKPDVGLADPLDAAMAWSITSARVGPQRLASWTALRLDHRPSTGFNSGA